jgi:hypothetical protein
MCASLINSEGGSISKNNLRSLMFSFFKSMCPRWLVVAWKVMTHKYRESQQSSRNVKPKFIDSTQGELKNIYKS